MKPRAEIKSSRDRALYCDGWDRGKAFGHGKISNALAWRRIRAYIRAELELATDGIERRVFREILAQMTVEAKRAGKHYDQAQRRESAESAS